MMRASHIRTDNETRSRTVLLLSGFLFSLALTQCTAQTPNSGTIVAGESVAGLKLGSTLSEFQAMFPKKPNIDEDFSNMVLDGCPSSYHWVDLERGATGVYAILEDGRISQLSVKTPRFHLANGIATEYSAAQVKHLYPHGKEFVLVGSGGKDVGGRDLHYWVDSSDGLAFELYGKKRLVSGITIFGRGKEYLPDGCISPPQEWRAVDTSHSNRATESRSN